MGIFSLNTLKITPEILSLIAEIDEFKGAWQHMEKISPDRLTILKKVATIECIGSSTRIEGSRLSDQEIDQLLSSSMNSFHSRDEQEVLGYAYVCAQIYENYSSIPFSENSIKQLHAWLLRESNKDERHRGEYKKIPVNIEAYDSSGKRIGIIFETTSPLETPIKMSELIEWVNKASEEKKIHPLIIIGIFIVLFLGIHPFQDGNGRLARLLTTLLLLKNGYLYVPYSSLESIIEKNKQAYYLTLQRTQKSWQNHKPNWLPWLQFFFGCLQRQKSHLEIKLEREKAIKKTLTPLSKSILNLISDYESLGIREIQTLTKANRNTIKKALAMLTKENYLVIEGKGKSTKYRIRTKL